MRHGLLLSLAALGCTPSASEESPASGASGGMISSGGTNSGGAGGRVSTSTSTAGASTGGDVTKSDAEAGNGAGVGAGSSGTSSCGVSNVWQAMSTDNIDWPDSDGWMEQPDASLASGYGDGKIYALRWGQSATDPVNLLTFDLCANAWTQTEQSYSTGDLWQVCPGGDPKWQRDHFQCGNVSASAALVFPNDPTLQIVAAGTVLVPPSPWDLSSSDSRTPATAQTTKFALAWGGEQRSASDSSPTNDGQLYSFATQTYRSTTLSNAPTPRYLPQLVALGDRFWIWGGFATAANGSVEVDSALSDGAIYDPLTDRFTPISSLGAPAETHADLLDRTQTMAAISNGADVFVVDSTNGAGGVYASELDRWFPLTATTAPFDISGMQDWVVAPITRSGLHILDSGDLIWIGPRESRLASKRGGDWKSFTQGDTPEPPPRPAMDGSHSGGGYAITQWTGSALVQWGPWSLWATGCTPPPDRPCDPLYIVQSYKFGEILWTAPLLAH